MDKITELRLQHFQPHTDRKLPISDITVLAGRSDSGKSACLRSLRWLCLNVGSPASYTQRGKPNVAVTVKTGEVSADTPHTITRQNGGKKNGYVLDGHEFNAIGKDIPPDVFFILNVIPDNFQTQHDYLYWFTDSGSELVKRIETTFGLTESAEWAATAKTEFIRLEKEVKGLDDQIASLTNEIAALSVYREFDKDYKHIETLTAQASKLQADRTRIIALVQAIRFIPSLPDDSVLARSEQHLYQKTKRHRLAELQSRYPATLPAVDSSAWLTKAESHLQTKDKATRLYSLHRQYPPVISAVDPSDCVSRLEAHIADKVKATRLYQLAAAHQSYRLPVIDASLLFAQIEKQITAKTRAARLKGFYDQHAAVSTQLFSFSTSYNESEALIVSLTGQPCPTCGHPLSAA
jgi:hypothetical protein